MLLQMYKFFFDFHLKNSNLYFKNQSFAIKKSDVFM